MIPTLFPDQELSIGKLREKMSRHKSVMLQGETGSGKSVMASYMIAKSRQKGLTSAFVVPRRELLHQMSETFNDFEISHSFVSDKKPFNPYSPTHICTVGSLATRKHKIASNLIFFDETHFGGAQLDDLIAYYRASKAWVIGLSATPEKTNGEGLDKYYDAMIEGPTIRELIKLKRLSDYKLYAPSRPDLSGIGLNKDGEYKEGQISSYMEHAGHLIGDAVRHYSEMALGKRNITFCTSVKHSMMTAEAFRAAGIPTAHMDGDTPEDERKAIAKAFARRELINICSVDLMTFGYDLAAASGDKKAVIESMSDLRPTKSRPLQRQKNGRVLRAKDYPGIILDHAGNAAVHGMPCTEVHWTLKGEDKTSKGAGRGVAVRQCPTCYYVSAPSFSCENCGHVYEVNSRILKTIDGVLVEMSTDYVPPKKEQGMAKTLEQLILIGEKRGMKNARGWAKHVWEARNKKNL